MNREAKVLIDGEDSLFQIFNNTKIKNKFICSFGDDYGNILEISISELDGEICHIDCINVSNISETITSEYNSENLPEVKRAHFFPRSNIEECGNFQVIFNEQELVIELESKKDICMCCKSERLEYYLDHNHSTIAIKIKNLTKEEYSVLKKYLEQHKNNNNDDNEFDDIIKGIEKQENIDIMQGCIIGSLAWGDNDPDSDKDIRFVYVRNLKDYLSFKKKEDNLHYPISDKLDLEGWDLTKFLSLLSKQNSGAYELLFSPKQIIESEYINKLKEYAQSILVPSKMALQYVSIVERRMREMDNKESMKLKLYLYFLRLICVAKYVQSTGQFPICNFDTILSIPENAELKYLIEDLIKHKKNGVKEIKIAEFMKPLLIKECSLIKSRIKEDEPIIEDLDKLDEFFIEGLEFLGKTFNESSEKMNRRL